MAYTPTSLHVLLKDLSLSDDSPNHAEILKHANHVLKTNKTNPEALKAKIVALLHLDRFEDVLRTLEKVEEGEVMFEKAYALYKSGKWELAAEVARLARGVTNEKIRRGLKHVEAQSAHRSEHFAKAAEIYKSLLDDKGVLVANEDYDLKVNSSATEAQLVWSGASVTRRKVSAAELSAFETAYNAGCIHIARNEYPQGVMLLKKARDLCEEMDMSEEDKKEEMAPVIAQQVYALLKMEKIDEATKLSQELDTKTLLDVSLKIVASNNDISWKGKATANPYLSLRLFEATVTKPLSALKAKPYEFQSRILSRNKVGLDLSVGKYDAVAHHAAKTPDAARSAYAIAAKAGQKTPSEILKVAKKVLLTEEGKSDVAAGLYATQLQMELGNVTGAIETVETLLQNVKDEHKHAPALVGLLVALHRCRGRKKPPKQLGEAALYWKNAPKPNEQLLLADALDGLMSPSPERHSSSGALLSSLPSTTSIPAPILSAGLVAAYAITNPSLAAPHTSALPSPADLLRGIDASALEAAGIYTPPPPPSKKRSAEEEEEAVRKKKAKLAAVVKTKRVRKSRLPKDFDPSKKADPERWLPLRDRSTYRPKGGKKGRKAMTSQGVTHGGRVEEEKGGDATGKVAVGGGGGGGGVAKKKKKRGGKW